MANDSWTGPETTALKSIIESKAKDQRMFLPTRKHSVSCAFQTQEDQLPEETVRLLF